MMDALEKASGKKITYKMCDRRPGDMSTVVANPAKANAEFNWKTTRGIDEIMQSAWKWQSQNPYGYDESPTEEREGEAERPFNGQDLRSATCTLGGA